LDDRNLALNASRQGDKGRGRSYTGGPMLAAFSSAATLYLVPGC